MIVQEAGEGLLLFRQTDHALLSGAFARAWGNDTVPAPARRSETVIAASRHDDGWAQWELAPRLAKDGEPVDFIGIPVREHVALYKRGIDLVEEEDDYAGLVTSLHGERLYTKPFYPGMDPRIEHLEGEDLELATAYVEGERARQERLAQALGDDARPDAEEGWRLLQVWDRLSLLVCMQRLDDEPEQELPPVTIAGQDVRIVARGTPQGHMLCDPYPFATDPAVFSIEALRTTRRTWDAQADYRLDVRMAEREIVTFSAVSAGSR